MELQQCWGQRNPKDHSTSLKYTCITTAIHFNVNTYSPIRTQSTVLAGEILFQGMHTPSKHRGLKLRFVNSTCTIYYSWELFPYQYHFQTGLDKHHQQYSNSTSTVTTIIFFNTWRVCSCFSLNLFSKYLRTMDVLPTAPSPNSTTLALTAADCRAVEFLEAIPTRNDQMRSDLWWPILL